MSAVRSIARSSCGMLGTIVRYRRILAAVTRGSLHLGWSWLLLPVVFALLLCLVIGISLATSTLYAFFRDIAFLVDTVLLFLYWGTPILYPSEALEGRLRTAVEMNPFGAVVISLRTILMQGALPAPHILLATVIGTLVPFALGIAIYSRHAVRLPDQL